MHIANEVFTRHPETLIGAMTVADIDMLPDMKSWNALKRNEISEFHATWSDYDRKQAVMTSPLACYVGYYKQFKKTYPVLLQMESVLHKGREIQASSLAVEALFLAEVKYGLLAAGHDLDRLPGNEHQIKLAKGDEEFTIISGQKRNLKMDDIFWESDGKILSSVLEGQDYDTRLTEGSHAALYCAYGVGGITERRMVDFFLALQRYLKTAFPQATVSPPEVIKGGGK